MYICKYINKLNPTGKRGYLVRQVGPRALRRASHKFLRLLTNPTQRDDRRKNTLLFFYAKSANFSAQHFNLFIFSWGWDCYCIGNRLQKTQPNWIIRRHPTVLPEGEKGRHLPAATDFVQKTGNKNMMT